MKREDIKKLLPDANDDQIDQIMNLHSADVGSLKQANTALTTQRDQLKTQLEAANTEIKGFKEQDPGAFVPENDDKTPVAVKGGGGGLTLGSDAALRFAFGLPNETK